jgi:hypothetical protein
MKRFNRLSRVVLVVVCSALLALGQSAATQDSNSIVPRLVRFSGSLSSISGKPPSSTVGVTFSLYKDSDGGSPLWVETQNVQPDSKGHYTVLLGSTKSDGVSSDLFASGEARWLGVQPQGQAEQARVLMVSVPYALKAVDAETLGGKPASAFQLALPQALSGASSVGGENSTAVSAMSGQSSGKASTNPANPPCARTTDYIPFFDPAPATFCNSIIYQLPANNYVGVNRINPLVQFDVSGAINAEPIASQQNSGNFGILKTPVLSIGWPEANVIPSNGNLWVGSLAGGQGASTGDNAFPNTFVGYRSGAANTSGTFNSFLGYNSGAANTGGLSNTFLGHQSGLANITGSYNSFLGTGSGKSNTGSKNTFLGYRSGYTNTTGQDNTFVGLQSGFSNTNGSSNTFVGMQSGSANSTGAENTFVGLQSGLANTTGVSNAFLGLGSGLSNTTGNSNTFLGAGACSNITTGNGDICIGYGVNAPTATTGATIVVGAAQTATYVAGIYNETVDTSPLPVCISSDGKLGTSNCPAAGTGTVTSVGSGLGLTGGPITTSGTLKIDTTVVPLLNTANTFTANQTIDGGIAAYSGTFLNTNPSGAYAVFATSVDPPAVSYGVYGIDQTASAVGAGYGGIGVWGDSSQEIGVQGTSDANSAFYGENNTGGSGYATGWFVNDSTTVGDLVVEADGGNGSCYIDVNGDLLCDGALSANNITTGSGGSNTDLAGSCTLSGGTCSQTFSTSYVPAPICVATDTTAANAVQVSTTSTTLTINGTAGDGANYICIGQEIPPPRKFGHGHHRSHRSPAVHSSSKEHKQ